MARITRKKKIAIITAALVLVGSGAAFAYWTAGGTGTGSAATASATSALTVNQTSTITGLAPGAAAQTLSGDFTNPNAAPVYVATVTASIGSITGAAGTCDASDYTLAGSAMTVNAEVDTGTAWSGATIQFNNKAGVNQDGCKGATVNLTYAVS